MSAIHPWSVVFLEITMQRLVTRSEALLRWSLVSACGLKESHHYTNDTHHNGLQGLPFLLASGHAILIMYVIRSSLSTTTQAIPSIDPVRPLVRHASYAICNLKAVSSTIPIAFLCPSYTTLPYPLTQSISSYPIISPMTPAAFNGREHMHYTARHQHALSQQ